MSFTRRDFLGAGATAAAGLALTSAAGATPLITVLDREAPRPPGTRPVAVASENGLRGVGKAVEMMNTGADPLDAGLAGVNIQELDPEDDSVGLGGLPNADGVVQLDASVMHGPTRRAGAVASLEDIATPSLVAKAVMDYTDHIMLVGPGAKRFALELGFKEQNLLTEKSRQAWLHWRARVNTNDNWLDVEEDVPIGFTTGTINLCAVNAAGDIASVTTTSGLSWKIPGRIGDSPIIGAGQYCDNGVGAAGSTGRGEANIKVCGGFLTVELMRQGNTPEQAVMKVLERVVAMTERRLLDERGRPRFDINFYAVAKDGRYASASLYEGRRFAVADAKGARLENCAYLFKRSERPTRR
ncbi:MAG TPA: N(4)-(beta-N-acetylglucosaminyl)-L-asparaginase [Gemmatimonadaceae bacterium]|nr:N(4)-(beta-N-acetylglucosaminyl)-L-asparaginase [Gemmatimonadaceae bacterium]